MASVTILSDNGATSGSAGLKTSGGNDGVLLLQTTTAGGTPTTAISISNTQVVTYTNQPTYTGGTANGVLYLNGSKAVTSGTALVFDGTNLGIGVTPSAWGSTSKALQFSTGAFEARATSFSSNTNAYFNSSWLYVGTGRATLYNQTDGSHAWYTAGSGTAGNAITFTQAMTLDSSGNLALGTTSPYVDSGYTSFTVNGTSTGSEINFQKSGTLYGQVVSNSTNGLVLSAAQNTPMLFYTGGSERARISSAGVFTTPYQPVVAAYRSSNLTGYNQADQGLVTIFNSTEVNIGSCYSTSTGLFTAPATGTYLYYASAYTGGPATLSQVWPVQNGTRGRSSRVGPANDVAVGTGVVYMTSGETLGVHFYGSDTSSTIASNSYHTFLYIYFLG